MSADSGDGPATTSLLLLISCLMGWLDIWLICECCWWMEGMVSSLVKDCNKASWFAFADDIIISFFIEWWGIAAVSRPSEVGVWGLCGVFDA